MDDRVWYFAFGANMSPRVLALRRVLPVSREAAALPGYRLVFEERGIPVVEPAFASVVRAEGETVHGVLMQLERHDFDRIDATEGSTYALLEIDVVGRLSGPVTAVAFQSTRPGYGLRPSRRYLELLVDGARENNLPDDYVRALAAHPSVDVPGAWLVSHAAMLLMAATHRLGLTRHLRPPRRRVRG